MTDENKLIIKNNFDKELAKRMERIRKRLKYINISNI